MEEITLKNPSDLPKVQKVFHEVFNDGVVAYGGNKLVFKSEDAKEVGETILGEIGVDMAAAESGQVPIEGRVSTDDFAKVLHKATKLVREDPNKMRLQDIAAIESHYSKTLTIPDKYRYLLDAN